jgi:nucleoid DNA-binding protein
MKNPQVGRKAVAALVRTKLNLPSDRQADHLVNTVTDSIVQVIRENIDTNGFELKLPSFGKFVVRHKRGRRRLIRLTGKIQLTADKRKVKFLPLSKFREMEAWPSNS